MANMYNINIEIFTYNGNQNYWRMVCPDPEMVGGTAVKLGKLVPDMALYYSLDTHYDLLVRNDSRLALLGMLAGVDDELISEPSGEDVGSVEIDDWRVVQKKKKSKSKKQTGGNSVESEELLKEDKEKGTNDKNLVEEIVLVKAKKSGFRRTDPQDVPFCENTEKITHKCMICMFEFESDGILEAHQKTHKKEYTCDICSDSFESNHNLKEHQRNEHQKQLEDEWNCDGCPFQANCASVLMKHLKTTGHQPSKNIKDKRKVFNDYKQCFTCKMDFDGFYNLMNHRKKVHPSSKKCRNFSSGNCPHGRECWYVHGEETEDTLDRFRCDLCESAFVGRNNYMIHKKIMHPQYVPSCEKFKSKTCPNSNIDCWFEHIQGGDRTENSFEDNPWPKLVSRSPPRSKNPVFREVTSPTLPPDQVMKMMDMVSQLCLKMENMEKKINDLVN